MPYRRFLCAFGLIVVLGGCAGGPEQPARPATTAAEDKPAAAVTEAAGKNTTPRQKKPRVAASEVASSLTPELLTDILVASIASQRGQPEVALESLSRAVYASRDTRLNANAIQLALQLEDYEEAIQLSRLMLRQEPENFRVILALANALIQSDRLDDATTELLHLVEQQEQGDEPILQEIASLIGRQDRKKRDKLVDNIQTAAEKDDAMVVFTAALIASRMKKEDLFRDYLERTLKLQPEWETAAILKLTDAADNDPDSVRDWSDSYLESYPESERFRVQLARLLIQEDELEQALEELDLLLEIKPDSSEGLFTAALVNMDLKNYDPAIEQFRKYIKASKNNDQAKLYLAQIHIEQEQYSEASPLLRQIQSRRYYLDAQITLSTVIAKQSNVEAGLSYLRNIDVRGEEQIVRLILEQDSLLREFDQQDRSFELLGEALEARPEQPDLLYSRGLLAANLDRIDVVEKDLKKLIKIQPDNAHAYNALGYTLADQTDRYDEALELITKALEFLPDDAFILDSMGWVHYRKGDHDKALGYLKRAVELKEDAEIAAHLGEVLWITGKRLEAEEIWDKGKEWNPENVTLLKTIDRFLGDEDQRAVLIEPGRHQLAV